ncbi:unnamed protein product, partial [Mesorhabditis belari]|uniref:Major sperm protein n=1 Tax=Mesorhabditis belari TaxID=2138241 RepID=A0AAF3EWM9_9BILA
MASSVNNFVILDQTLIMFDVEQVENASQTITIRRHPDCRVPVCWRLLTNGPTRYMVAPNGGIINNSNPLQIRIELLENKYDPRHIMHIQAIEAREIKDFQVLWAALPDPSQIQKITLELSTTVLSLDRAVALGEEAALSKSASLTDMLSASNLMGEARLKELQQIHACIEADTERIKSDCEEMERLKAALIQKVDEQRAMVQALQKQLEKAEETSQRLQKEEADANDVEVQEKPRFMSCVCS